MSEMGETMNQKELLAQLEQNCFDSFHFGHFGDDMCHLGLQDGTEVIVQLSDHTISKERVECLKHVLANHETYLVKAVEQIQSFGVEIGESYFSYGIYVGEFSFGTHGFQMFDGFAISLKREDGTTEDPFNLDVFTVQFKRDGHPLGVDLWFE